MSIVAPPSPPARFSAPAALLAHLTEAEAAADLLPLTDPAAVLVDATGRTLAGGYRLTGWALDQVCRAVCPGLNRLVAALDASADRAERTTAVDTYNRLVRLRFEATLAGGQILYDRRAGTVEGVVGGEYKWLPHRRLADLLAEAVGEGGAKFLTAVAAGRWLLVRYYVPGEYVARDGGWRRGWHASAHEAGGGSVRVSAALVRAADRSTVLAPTGSSCVRHSGATFEARLATAFGRAADGLRSAAEYEAAIDALADPLVSPGSPLHVVEKRLTTLVDRLAAAGVPFASAARVVRAVALGGLDGPPCGAIESVSAAAWATRTGLAAVVGLAREAKGLAVPYREKVERVAHAVLVGDITLTGD